MDADTGAVLYENNSSQKLYPASITKIMTGLLAIENLNLNDSITYSDAILNALPSDAAKLGLVSGETTSIQDALYALMLRSANEVAIGLATKVSGSESEFAKLMTERSVQAGALNTNFVNATGLHDENHYTTAYDMAMITKTAMANPEFSTVWGSENYTLAATNMSEGYRIWHRHQLLLSTSEYYYPYAIGGKTGYTDEAGRTLVTAAEKDGLKLIAVIMQSDDDHVFSDTISLFNYGFHNFSKVSIKNNETRFGSGGNGIPVINKLYGNTANVFSLANDSIIIPNTVSLSDIPYTIDYLDEIQNGVIATITYQYNGNYLGKTSLILNVSSTADSSLSDDSTQNNTIRETTSINIYLLIGSIVTIVIVVFLLSRFMIHQRKIAKRKKRRTYK
jgi:D-alanyl-D-alanine carboxypeptidase